MASNGNATNVCILFYSMYGHTYHLAQAVYEGVNTIEGCVATLLQVPETMPDRIMEKNEEARSARQAFAHIPVATASMLKNFDAIIVGTPTRFGNMCGQMRSFWDVTGSLWVRGLLAGKVASVFVTASTQHGGIETTATSTYNTFAHHGMIIVPMGYTTPLMSTTDEVFGGSPYGAGSISKPDGTQYPTNTELTVAKLQGARVAQITHDLKLGRSLHAEAQSQHEKTA